MGNATGPASQRPAPKHTQPHGHRDKPDQMQEHSSFTPRQRQALMRRYQTHDSSKDGRTGIPLDVCLAMPEFAGNNLIGVLIHDYLDPQTGRMHPQGFLQFCTLLSSCTTPAEKKKILFDSFNVYGTDTFTHDEIFRLYKVLLGRVISDDHILALTFEALRHPGLEKEGQITKNEFLQMVPDSEIEQKLTLQFNLPAG
ncbi:calcineurin subunit b type 1 [Plakobranchus ocellatus]|uniref:Calcineurin subunit b type 1 n=1 Tax=Plakobranchus ocellatus TaxID=259542 RepID=A0AAV3ZGI8_9GAST|nr:calcineurin subunit b type 1 [Plakobranchus ocellatus]